MERIVIGVDGSETSLKALRWALRYARHTNAVVHLLHSVWETPVAAPSLHFGPQAPTERIHPEQLQSGQALLDHMLAAVADEAEGVTVHRDLVTEPPAQTLLERSREVDLVVVGSRGLGSVRELLLGSVSRRLVHDAQCPVVVIPPIRRNS